MFRKAVIKLIFVGIIFLTLPSFSSADSFNQQTDFFIDPDYDLNQREEISAILQRITPNAYFYIDKDWWESLDEDARSKTENSLTSLEEEFKNKIYPTLTSTYGSEWKPGIDKNERITILIHSMIEGAGGYFRNIDGYPRIQAPTSNKREMVYLNADYITDHLAKSFLAHEFTHLITFNQKEKIWGVEEEIWLNEARAEYAPTLVGYDSEYERSNLEKRVRIFLENPSDSLTEWLGQEADYGSLNLFTQYLVEQYGVEILADSLKSDNVGIKSLNYALEKNGFKEDFSQIFTDWTVAVSANDCSLGEKYCYKNKNLKNLRITPSINFLPLIGKSTLGVNQTTKNWSGNWFKFIGGKGTLRVEFIGNPENLFKVPYLSMGISGEYSLDFFQLDEYQRGEILVPKFWTEVSSVTIIPTIQSKTSGFLSPEPAFPFFWEASTKVEIEEAKEETNSKYLEKPISQMAKEEILAKISEIEALLNQLREQFAQIEGDEAKASSSPFACARVFDRDLYYGMRNDAEVRCLQKFLKTQGETIYPEGLITGNFLTLTQTAVIRFQEKYASEILAPLGLNNGTGYVGAATRNKINQIPGF